MQEALYTFTNGLYIIGACTKTHYAGAIVDSITQIAATPPLIMLSMMNSSHTKSCIETNKEFSLSVLPEDIDPFIVANFGFQSGHNIKKWEQIDYIEHDSLPYIKDALAQIRFKVIDKLIYPHNTIFIAQAVQKYQVKEARPLTYKYYREHLKPLCHNQLNKKAYCNLTTNPKEKSSHAPNHAKHWVCSICQYVYEDKIPFETLPDNWRCPFCGVSKEMFELI